MGHNISFNTMEKALVIQALKNYSEKAEVAALEYEKKVAEKEKYLEVPFIHPRVVADTAKNVLSRLEGDLNGKD